MPPIDLPYGRHLIDQEDIDEVVSVLRSDWLTGGPAVADFEEVLSEVTGAAHAIACSSGTAALHLAAAAVGLGPGDWAVVPAVTFLATANVVRHLGAEVLFADVDPHTGLLTAETFAAALEDAEKDERNVRVALPVHLNGQVADPLGIWKLAEEAGLEVIEDSCHAIGTSFETASGESRVGECRFSRMSAFSFHPVKTVAMGEGGAVTTGDAGVASHLRLLRNHGMTRDESAFVQTAEAFDSDGSTNPWYYEMAEPGFNLRASDIHCALGASQLRKLDHFVESRRRLVELYDQRLESLQTLVRPVGRVSGCRPAWHLYVVLVDFEALGLSRAGFMSKLADRGIGSQVHFLPVNRQPYYRARYGERALRGADSYYSRCVSLPLVVSMTESDVDRVVGEVEAICNEAH